MRNRISLLYATGFGIGFVPGPKGTYGSLLGVLLWLGIASLNSRAIEAEIAAVLLLLAVPAASHAARILGREDPSQVVCDEICGQLVALFLAPVTGTAAITGFLLFRAFDIIKPYPVNRLERLSGGWGIVADDVMAGIYANLALSLLLYAGWLPKTIL